MLLLDYKFTCPEHDINNERFVGVEVNAIEMVLWVLLVASFLLECFWPHFFKGRGVSSYIAATDDKPVMVTENLTRFTQTGNRRYMQSVSEGDFHSSGTRFWTQCESERLFNKHSPEVNRYEVLTF
jgi:hypothetical protein